MTERPPQLKTLLVTSMADGARHWAGHPEAMSAVLTRHDALLRAAITRHGGAAYKLTSEAFEASFPAAPQALAAAVVAQQALFAEPWGAVGSVQVSMALATGLIEEQGGEYMGPVVDRAARLLDAGHSGQILLSAETAGLGQNALPPGAALRDLGEHHLRDLVHTEHIFQLIHPDLPDDFPPLRTLEGRPNNLIRRVPRLVGRTPEVEQCCQLLRRGEVRLLTLVGPGGIGKTRLATQVAAELLGDFADGVFWISLGATEDPVRVPLEIARGLGISEGAEPSVVASLQTALRDKQLLLVLDNFEQVAEAAPLIGQLLAAAPQLEMLVTSRARLNVRGEYQYPVPPLSVPLAPERADAEGLSQYEAVMLFVERAQAVDPEFVVTDENAPAIAEICARLDGLPLAIELAATRIRLLSPQAMLGRLSNRLALLTGGKRDVPARRQTMRGALDWSYELLADAEKTLFRRLGVFVGGCTLDAAEAVCNLDGLLDIDVLEGVASLADKSLLQQAEQSTGDRWFWMLGIIRDYARERLAASGEEALLCARHAQFFLALSEQADRELRGPRQRMWLDRLERDHDNLRAALTWSQEQGEHAVALRLVGALWRFWWARGYLSEGRARLEAVLAQARPPDQPVAPSPALAHALYGAGFLAFVQGEFAAARPLFEESLATARALGDKAATALALIGLGQAAYHQADYPAARRLNQESLQLRRELADTNGMATALNNLGLIAASEGDLATAEAHLAESLALSRAGGDLWGIAAALNNQALVARRRGDYPAASAYGIESLTIRHDLEDQFGIALSLAGLAATAVGAGYPEQAARLLGATDALLEKITARLEPIYQQEHDQCTAALRIDLGAWRWTAAWTAGRTRPLGEIIAEAQTLLSGAPPAAPAPASDTSPPQPYL